MDSFSCDVQTQEYKSNHSNGGLAQLTLTALYEIYLDRTGNRITVWINGRESIINDIDGSIQNIDSL